MPADFRRYFAAHLPITMLAPHESFQSGEQAVSMGYARRVGKRASFSIDAAFSSSERSAGVGFGVDL